MSILNNDYNDNNNDNNNNDNDNDNNNSNNSGCGIADRMTKKGVVEWEKWIANGTIGG